MGTLKLSSYAQSSFSVPFNFNYIRNSHKTLKLAKHPSFSRPTKRLSFSRGKIRAVGTIPEGDSKVEVQEEEDEEEEPPFVGFTFVSSVLLPDGSPDIHFRKACGGQTLRRIMLDTNIDLYGPYARPLLNCAGGGTCATCLVEIVGGEELLNPRTNKEKEKLKKKPKTYRLACQATVGKPDSTGMLVVQQLPEWKAHQWNYEKIAAAELESQLESS